MEEEKINMISEVIANEMGEVHIGNQASLNCSARKHNQRGLGRKSFWKKASQRVRILSRR